MTLILFLLAAGVYLSAAWAAVGGDPIPMAVLCIAFAVVALIEDSFGGPPLHS